VNLKFTASGCALSLRLNTIHTWLMKEALIAWTIFMNNYQCSVTFISTATHQKPQAYTFYYQ
jgi:hypothetical protein